LLASAAAAALTPSAAAQPGAVTLAVDRDIQGALDPAARLSALEANILRAVCPGLIAFRPGSFDWQPHLAAEISQVDARTIAFALRPGLRFSGDFGDVTASDVKFSFERFRTPGPDRALPPYAADWEALDGVEVTDRLAGRIHLKTSAPMLWRTVLPDASGCIISRAALDHGAYRTDRPNPLVVGAGPLRFATWDPQRQLVLEADPDWPGKPSDFARIRLRPVRDRQTAALALRADDLQFAPLDPAAVDAAARQADTRAVRKPSINMVWLGINAERPPFTDLRVRRAVALALDLDQVVEGAWNGTAPRAYAAIAPGLPGAWPDAPRPRRDVAQARALLSAAGASGLRARLTLLNQPQFQDAAVIIQAMLAEVGIRIDLDLREGGAFWSAGSGETGKRLELVLQRFAGKADPAFNLQWFTAAQIGQWNWQRWHDATFDALIRQAATTEDGTERDRLYIEAQQRMAEGGAFIWLTHEVYAYACRDWLVPAVLPDGDDMSYDLFRRA
jgi:peptide/nickel transport system substrate-binding protein